MSSRADFYNGLHTAPSYPNLGRGGYNGNLEDSPLRHSKSRPTLQRDSAMADERYERERRELYQRSRLETEVALLKYARLDKREHSPSHGLDSDYYKSTEDNSQRVLTKYDMAQQKDTMRGPRNFEKAAYKDSYPIRCVSTENMHKTKRFEYEGYMAELRKSQLMA